MKIDNPFILILAASSLACIVSTERTHATEVIFSDNFDGYATGAAALNSNWSSSSQAFIWNGTGGANSPYIRNQNDYTDYFEYGKALFFQGSGTRQATTRTVNLLGGGNIRFNLSLGTASGYDGPFENQDASDEYVQVEFSLNSGSNWSTLRAFDLNETNWTDANRWNLFSFNIADTHAAAANNVMFRIRQLGHSGSAFDTWAIDNFRIGANVLFDVPSNTQQVNSNPTEDISLPNDTSLVTNQSTNFGSNDINFTGTGGINTNGHDSSISGDINGSGTFVKDGAGTLTVSGAVSPADETIIMNGTMHAVAGATFGAPIRIINNGKFLAGEGVQMTNDVVLNGLSATYEKHFANEDLSNAGLFGNETVQLAFGAGTGSGSMQASFSGRYTMSINGLDGTDFLLVMYVDIPALLTDSMTLIWRDGDTWRPAVEGNHGADGDLAGYYSDMSYQSFLSLSPTGWDADLMRGAHGSSISGGYVWAVIDHNSSFTVDVLIVPEPSSFALLAAGAFALALRRKRKA